MGLDKKMLLSLKTNIIYGPVNSRRLGQSLGVNILPSGEKVCSFDCLYCQYGFSPSKDIEEVKNFPFPTVDAVSQALQSALDRWGNHIAYITFSGNGEPTLHPHFPDIVSEVITLKNRFAPQAKTAILSNSTMVGDPIIRRTLMRLDRKIMKLDTGSQHMLSLYNRPSVSFDLDKITEGLSRVEGLTIQSLFTGGPDGNFNEKHLGQWIEHISYIAPELVQVYSLDRNSPTRSLMKLTENELKHIQSRLQKESILAAVFP